MTRALRLHQCLDALPQLRQLLRVPRRPGRRCRGRRRCAALPPGARAATGCAVQAGQGLRSCGAGSGTAVSGRPRRGAPTAAPAHLWGACALLMAQCSPPSAVHRRFGSSGSVSMRSLQRNGARRGHRRLATRLPTRRCAAVRCSRPPRAAARASAPGRGELTARCRRCPRCHPPSSPQHAAC